MTAISGLPGAQRQRLGGGQSHHHAADQAGSRRGGDGVNLSQFQTGFFQGAFDHAIQYFQMGAGGDFRHHAAIRRMRFGLAENDVGQNFAGPGRKTAHHRRRGFIAAGFQPQYGQSVQKPMSSAKSLSSNADWSAAAKK